jgi:hypothetical protein
MPNTPPTYHPTGPDGKLLPPLPLELPGHRLMPSTPERAEISGKDITKLDWLCGECTRDKDKPPHMVLGKKEW